MSIASVSTSSSEPGSLSPFRRVVKSCSRFLRYAGWPLNTIVPFVSIKIMWGTPLRLYSFVQLEDPTW